MSRLESKVALISGAARGIGRACAELFAREGAIVVATDIADTAAVVAAIGPRATADRLDVRREEDWETAIARVLAVHGRLDVLVNNAGITGFDPPMGPHDPEQASLDAWRAVHATNLDGVFLGCKHAIGAMKPPARGGSIINISSRSGLVGISRAAAYASSKAGVRNHTKSVALYCAEMGYPIRCNSIHPGAILTPMWEPMLGETPEARAAAIAAFAAEVPLGRMGSAEDVAQMALYLASDESSYVTGAEFVIDGGLLAGTAATPKRE
ncbi:MAG: SDR family oxidoreductase [Phycisphaerae bacterium]|nr:SDR family oxidoreductase [Phycisphaerae bacterium]